MQEFSTGLKQRFPITSRLAQAKAVARVDVAMALAEVRTKESKPFEPSCSNCRKSCDNR